MGIKLNQLIKINGAINDLVLKDKENKLLLSSEIRSRQRDNIKSLRPAMQSYMDKNNALVEEYGVLIPDGSGLKEVKQDSENWPAFKAKFEAMLEEEYDVQLKTITESELFGAETAAYRNDVNTIIALGDLGLLVPDAEKVVKSSKKK